MRELKFRQPIFDINGKFTDWHYWGYIDGCFRRPMDISREAISFCVKGEAGLQFTGLHDKNGKEVYEGDVTSIKEHMNPNKEISKAIVMWDNKKASFTGLGLYPFMMIEIIGDIHTTPELLEGEK
jgi:hypothetical protein